MLKRSVFLTLGCLALGGLILMSLFAWLVVFNPGEEIRQENIEKILAVESPVYYRNGRDKVGVFFESAHRQYIPYDLIPENFVKAIVAAEDRNFFSHPGIDPVGVVRAMLANLKAGRVVQGGSTLTQQTAKNLFKRTERSISAKLKELLYAIRLEYHYPKEKILEFYANQFYVSGNGRGLGVAARYYFDKEPAELDLLECAFIAGSVKRPNYYNPFIKRDEESENKARSESKRRVGYVLRQMLRNGMITAAEYRRVSGAEIPFKQGQMYFSLNTVMDLVKEAMAEPELEEAFRGHGIDNVATSGIKIITSIEKPIQDRSLYALRKELSRLDVRLRGYDREEVQREYLKFSKGKPGTVVEGAFLFGRIVELDPAAGRLRVEFPGYSDEEVEANIDEAGLLNLLRPLMKYEKNRWTEVDKLRDLPVLTEKLAVGDLVYVSVRSIDGESGGITLDLERYPLLQGGVLAMKDGKIRAMVGGMENRYYNRAISARRPMGSVMKILVYSAALQLGWNNLDTLDNQRDVFVYQNRPYFPRPDHHSPFKGVSMSWAGVNSENLATIWLLYHLCDQLSPVQFRELVEHLGLVRQSYESAAGYRRRIRDQYGVMGDDQAVYRIAFARALADLEPDLIFAGKLKQYEILSRFHYGANFEKYLAAVDQDLSLVPEEALGDGLETAEGAADSRPSPLPRTRDYRRREKEAGFRKSILKRNFLRVRKMVALLDEFRSTGRLAGGAGAFSLYRSPETGRYIFTDEEDAGSGWERVAGADLPFILSGMGGQEENEFWQTVLIDNLLEAGVVEQLSSAVEKEFKKINRRDRYDPEILYEIRDFRIMVGLQYMIALCRELGIESQLEPVLSFPLGSNVISLLEVARSYEAVASGYSTRFLGQGNTEGLAIIEKILDSEGNVIYEPEPVRKRVLSPEVSIEVKDILRKVVKFGTGRYADRNVRLHSRDVGVDRQLHELDIKVPLAGKTGTANRFTNASFAGLVPGIGSGGDFSFADGYVLTSYVGFDDNSPMVRNSTHISGAAGALPLWSMVAEEMLKSGDQAARLDLVDLSFSGLSYFPLAYPETGQIEVPVDPGRGGRVSLNGSGRAAVLTHGEYKEGEGLQPTRFFKPFWRVVEN